MANDHDPTSREPVRPPTDYRAMRRRNDRALFLAVIAVLLVVGGGLIYIIYGTGALITGLACLLFGVGILLLLWLIMSAIERWANR
jgi:protein-S-isoprenylcysteine O-methyltransferase Ste14